MLKIGDYIQWESQGVLRFETPRKVSAISEDGKFVFVEGTSTGLPIEQVKVIDASLAHNEQSLRDSGIFKTCPKCHQRAVAIVYGYPTEQGLQLEHQGLIAYGGCCSCASDPGWVCLTCQHRFSQRIDSRDQFGHREKLDVYWEQIKVIESSRKNKQV